MSCRLNIKYFQKFRILFNAFVGDLENIARLNGAVQEIFGGEVCDGTCWSSKTLPNSAQPAALWEALR